MHYRFITFLFFPASLALLLAVPAMAHAADQTARDFLAQCDHFDPNCRAEFVAGLQAVYSGGLAWLRGLV